jgi:hypothetical protein
MMVGLMLALLLIFFALFLGLVLFSESIIRSR